MEATVGLEDMGHVVVTTNPITTGYFTDCECFGPSNLYLSVTSSVIVQVQIQVQVQVQVQVTPLNRYVILNFKHFFLPLCFLHVLLL